MITYIKLHCLEYKIWQQSNNGSHRKFFQNIESVIPSRIPSQYLNLTLIIPSKSYMHQPPRKLRSL